jgi:parafibromin
MIQPRGFFFDLSAPDDTGSQGYSRSSSPEPGDAPKSRHNDISPPSSRQWWETDTKHPSAGSRSTHAAAKSPPAPLMSPTTFELDLPEHLPNSPLCPKNPKYQSGRTGICVYHGRRRSIALMHLETTSMEESCDPSIESCKKAEL